MKQRILNLINAGKFSIAKELLDDWTREINLMHGGNAPEEKLREVKELREFLTIAIRERNT